MRHTARNIPPIALFILAIMMSWLSYSIFSVAARERLVTDQVQSDKIMLDRLQSQIEHSYRNRDFHWIQQSLGSVGANNDILRVSLADEAGTILADLNRATLGKALASTLTAMSDDQRALHQRMLQAVSDSQGAEIFRSPDHSYLGAVYPVTLVESGLESQRGVLWMETDLRRSKALAEEQIRLQTIALMIGFTFLAVCLGILFHVVITRRIDKLTGTMARVADGDLEARVRFTSKDEVGRLGHYFDEMLDRRQTVESALRQSQKLESIGTLASGIAHDFNNILQAISGYVRLAQSRAGNSDPDLARYLERIDSGSARATTLVQRILSFGRSTNAEFMAVPLQRVIEDSLELLKTTIPQDIRIKLDVDPACRPVVADSTQLQQVVTNLVTNAVQAVDQKTGVVRLRLREVTLDEPVSTLTGRLLPDAYAEFSVEDNGDGIPVEHLDRLFDPFFTTKEVGQGTGLGLSVVHGVVKHTKGGLLIDSENTGGARIVVLLPVARTSALEQGDSTQQQAKERTRASTARRILLVDDEAEIAQSSALLLQHYGHAVTIAITAKAALEFAERESFDIAVLDYRMPKINGLELATRLNARRELPVVIVTGLLADGDEPTELPAPVFRVIRKPYDVATLNNVISEILDR